MGCNSRGTITAYNEQLYLFRRLHHDDVGKALDFSTAFSHSTGFIYDSPVTSAAALAGSPTGPREGGVPSVVPTSDASAATSKAVDSGNTDGSLFGKSDSIPGDSRGYPPVGSVGFALSNDGSFTDWLKSIEVYHLIEHVLNKDYDCWDFNNKKIEGLLLLKVSDSSLASCWKNAWRAGAFLTRGRSTSSDHAWSPSSVSSACVH
ncbi:hypothetical protein TGARI_360610 [Toxoplasma gondii ARI]|uniref:Uncharacterized protein n=2 Tax=Toxoplasma gondii TaxID=5811 RepID=A0A086PLW7_TOXGO|nr:hypothetical protein TGMAS_360610 [Toxoplasma gondii MAS]KYF44976.1 hypothetical protein TGARI_360610 [Toxoplasma gondii ARI]